MGDYSGVEELLIIEKYLKNYNHDLILKLSEFLKNKEVLEFGAGIGTLAQIWKSQTGISPECLEIDHNLCDVVTRRGFKCYSNLDAITKKYDGIYTSSVLEHIEDDIAALKNLNSLLNKDAIISIYVPAFMLLYSGLDISVGHFRRYGKVEIIKKLEQTNFKIIRCHFSDSLGFFVSILIRIFGYKKNPKNFHFYDKYIYPLSSLLDRLGAKYFFGKNLLIIAQKLN